MFSTQLETSTLTNQNVSSALLAHTFTNTTRERIVRVGVYLKDLAGNGDYSVYATKQLAGTGTAYPSVLTTQAVPSGVTAHWFTSEWLDVGATDVLKIYVVGLGGDTSAVDIITQVKEMFVSTDSSGRVDLVDAPNATAVTAIQNGIEPSDVWSYAARTLTSISALAAQLASGVLDAVASSYNTAGTIGAKINTAAGAAGGGSSTYTATVTDANGNTLDGVQVWATTDVAGANIVASGVTNSHGQVTFALDPASYYLWRQRGGTNFSNPQGFTVT